MRLTPEALRKLAFTLEDGSPINMTPEQLKCICDLVVELTRLRQNEVKHLCIENYAPDLLRSLLMAYKFPLFPDRTAGPSQPHAETEITPPESQPPAHPPDPE